MPLLRKIIFKFISEIPNLLAIYLAKYFPLGSFNKSINKTGAFLPVFNLGLLTLSLASSFSLCSGVLLARYCLFLYARHSSLLIDKI
ncbi:hypothetical protein [Pigmentibacter ruber]|uniref:hypothetical protein n=1 Tax=Pigmentibacter ruber TaxID=2683196 RepID=UPI00131A6166|nr:hypothetical protein [Pigmentibacter ruber]